MTAKGKQNKRRERKSLKKKRRHQQWNKGIRPGRKTAGISDYAKRELARQTVEASVMTQMIMRGE